VRPHPHPHLPRHLHQNHRLRPLLRPDFDVTQHPNYCVTPESLDVGHQLRTAIPPQKKREKLMKHDQNLGFKFGLLELSQFYQNITQISYLNSG
jgi:hypothetical protein